MAKQLYQRLLLPASFFLPDLKDNVFFSVIFQNARISERVHEVFLCAVAGICKALPKDRHADKNAACWRFFSRILCQWFIANRAFRLALTVGILSWKNGFSSQTSFFDNVSSLIDSFSYLHIARWNAGSHLDNLLQLGNEVLGIDSAFGQVFHVRVDK